MIDRDKLHRLWTGSTLTVRDLAAYFDTTPGAIAGTIRRAQKAEGFERWPKRSSPIKPGTKRSTPPRLKPGRSTLPPLRSLDP